MLEQVTQWDFQNNAPTFFLEVPLRNLLNRIFNFVPCDQVCKGPINSQERIFSRQSVSIIIKVSASPMWQEISNGSGDGNESQSFQCRSQITIILNVCLLRMLTKVFVRLFVPHVFQHRIIHELDSSACQLTLVFLQHA